MPETYMPEFLRKLPKVDDLGGDLLHKEIPWKTESNLGKNLLSRPKNNPVNYDRTLKLFERMDLNDADSALNDLDGVQPDTLTEGKYWLSVQLKRETQWLFRENGLPVPTNSEMDYAGDDTNKENQPKTAGELMKRVLMRREVGKRDENEPYIKSAWGDSFMEKHFPDLSQTDEQKGILQKAIYEVFNDKFWEYPGYEDRIPLQKLKDLVRQKLNQPS